VKFPVAFVLAATMAHAEPHPDWWAYVAPESTALVGIHWNTLRNSPLASFVEDEISPSGGLGFPNLDCLTQADDIVISSPALLAVEEGVFPAAVVEDQAQRQGLRRAVYRGVTLWLPDQEDDLGVAQISERLVLVGSQKTLESAVDRSLSETTPQSSLLMSRAAHFSQSGDLWVAAAKLPDPLASLFVPLDADASQFLGRVSVRDGFFVEASLEASSTEAGVALIHRLHENTSAIPALDRALEASTDQNRVTVALRVNPENLHVGLVPLPPPPQGSAVEPRRLAAPVTFEITHAETTRPRIIRIFNLEEGTREIVLQPGHFSLDAAH